MNFLVYWLPHVLIGVIVASLAARMWFVYVGYLTPVPMSEPARRSYAAIVLVFFLLAAALSQTLFPIPLGIAMAMIVHKSVVHYHRQST